MRLKKLITHLTIMTSLLCSTTLWADVTSAMETYLKNIQNYTQQILTQVNKFPAYIADLTLMAKSWNTPDDSETTAQIQDDFTVLGTLLMNNFNAQNNAAIQMQLTSSLLGLPNTTALTGTTNTPPAILTSLPTVNDLTYTTLLGFPPVQKGGTTANSANPPAYNYVLNAGGLNIHHSLPPKNAPGTPDAIAAYQTYYNTVMAIQSFNAFVWGNLYADAQNGNALSTAQSSLVQQATQPSWFVQIGSEELGKVLRQILMFQSQSYVLMTQLIQTQKQLLTAQTMTNSLLILNNQTNESSLYYRANGIIR